jgi:hypothetical protein
MNTRINTVFVMVATLGLVLSIGILTTIHSQQAFALTRTHTGINGGMCTTNNCNANGGSGNGGNGGNSNGGQGGNGGNGGSGMNGGNGENGSPQSTTQPSPPQS